MSYILDALKKSERERELVRMLRSGGAAAGFSIAQRRRLWPFVTGLAVVLLVAFGLVRFWRVGSTPVAVAVPQPPAPAHVATVEPPHVTAAKPKPAARPEVRDLVDETRVTVPKPRAAPTPSPSPAPPAQAAAHPAEVVVLDPTTVPFLREMPADFRAKIPQLVLNVHLYSANESENLVYINNREYRKGDSLEGGIRLEEIVPDGVVLSYGGTFFKLPRPN